MTDTLTLPAPAKLNLFLHILGRRADGYHQLQTLFQLLDFGDELRFTRCDSPAIQLQPALPGVSENDNLIVRAARLLQKHCGVKQGASIQLEKRLPMGGGIGGGSSDAATTLLALNQLWHCDLDLAQLANLGRQLGADVPVFVQGRSSFAEGVGEILQPIELPEKYYLVLTPNCSVATASIFAHPELTRDTAAITVAAFFEQGTRNDCQALVERLYPDVAECIAWLSRHALATQPARLTGTGASVFASFDDRTLAEKILSESPWRGFVAKGVNRSPVHALLARV